MAYDFSKEEDVKDYLENLGIEYRFECFHEKKPAGCHRLGDYLEAVKKDYKKASKIYQTACDDMKFGQSCYKFGNYSFLGKGCKKDRDTAFSYFKRGCELENPESCLHTGLMLTNKIDGTESGSQAQSNEVLKLEDSEKNQTKSVDKRQFKEGLGFFEKGCALNNPTSCFFASSVYMMGTSDVPQDYFKSFEYSTKACDFGNVYACANLSRMYMLGNGTPKDEEMAARYKAKAIDLKKQHVKQFRQVEYGRTG